MTADSIQAAKERHKKVEEIVRDHFYPGPVAGSTERLTKALDEYFGAELSRLEGENEDQKRDLTDCRRTLSDERILRSQENADARRQIADLEYQLNSERVEAGELQRLAGQIAERDEALRLAHADLEVIYKASAHCQGRFGGRMSEVDRIFQEITRVSSLHHGRAALLSKGSEPDRARIAEIAKSEACQGDDGVICEGDCVCKRKATVGKKS